MTDLEWLQARRRGLGASDASAVCGLSPWRTPLHVYLDKVGEWTEPDSAPKAWGRRLEEVVAQAYAEETGRPVRAPENRLEVHPNLPWLVASLDRLTEVDGSVRVLECKTVRSDSGEWGVPGSDEVPPYYLVQCQHQLAVTGLEYCDLAALFGGQELRVYTIERDEALASRLRLILSEFWARVQERRPPLPTWTHPETPALVASMMPADESVAIELGEEEADWARRYRRLGEEVGRLQDEREVLKARLIHAMDGAARGILPGELSLRRHLVERAGYVVAPTTYHAFFVRRHP